VTRSLAQQIRRPRCPQCGQGKLFKDTLGIVDACSVCGLNLKHHDAADGPTFFALVVVGFLITGLAALVETHFEPPLWVHAVLWVPFTFLACFGCLRAAKTVLITLEYRLALLKQKDPHDPV